MRKDILLVLSLFSVAFLIRVVGVSNVCMYIDEWLYWTNANSILANNFAPTASVFKYTTPFLPYIGAVVTLLFEGDLNILRIISVVFGSLTVPMLYLFGKAMYDRKTGLLSALFLCFSAYHCLYSRIFMFEALTLFFITAFLYFFWLSQRSEGRKSTTYACLAGAMLGLAIDAKYISLFLIPVVLAYVLWTRKFSFKALMDKKINLIWIFALLFLFPLLMGFYTSGVGLDPLQFQIIGRFEKETEANVRVLEFSPAELLTRGTNNILGVLTRGDEILIHHWAILFKLSAILLFLITLFYYLPNFINAEKKGSFLMISSGMLFLTLLELSRYQHYLIYLLPFYFVMLSHLAIKSFEHLRIRKENSYKNIFRIFITFLVIIALFSSFTTGVTSPYWEEGIYSWSESATDYIKSDVTKSGYEHYVVIGITTLPEIIDYPLQLSHDTNAPIIVILKRTGEYESEKDKIDLEKIDMLKPSYLIEEDSKYYGYHFKENVKREILKDYEIVLHTGTYPHGCFVLKRKNLQPPEALLETNGKDGEIFRNTFERSMPGVMKVGEIYTALVRVENTGDYRTNFTINVYSDRYIIFVEDPYREITLDKGSTRVLKFKIVPIRGYAGELPITVDLYAKYEGSETYRKVDSVSDCIYLIKKWIFALAP